ncbi:MAG TPA: M56 family metallopeptidase [Vicinamibacterales bacterium]
MDAVANHIWQSTIAGGAAALLVLMCRDNSASVRYWIWFAAAMKFLVPFAALAAAANLVPLPQSPFAGRALEAATVVFRSSALPAMSSTASIVLIAVWFSGALAVFVRWAWQWNRLAAHARQSPRATAGIVHDTLRRIERSEGIAHPTAIAMSCHSIEPGVIGIRRPVLIWPQRLTAVLSDTQVEAIVAHEACHIVRRDNLFASVQLVVSSLFWFHPLVWWIGARLVDERERACDERVLARGERPAVYAESILKTCEICITSPLANVAGVTGGLLKTRIVRIMKNAPMAPLGVRRKTVLALAAALALLVPIVSGAGSRVPASAAAQDSDREVHRPGGRITTPKLIREVKPHYPERAKQDKVQGEVVMECVVKADGTVGDTKVVRSLDPDLDQAALDAAAQWLFEPGTRDGKPVNVLVTIAIAFTLK